MRIKLLAAVMLLLILFTVTACSRSEIVVSKTLNTEETSETQYYEETPSEEMAIVLELVKDEMRVFDVAEHHEALMKEISKLDKGLSGDEFKIAVENIVKTRMDSYFYTRIETILSDYNPNYGPNDVETLFNNTSRTALYDLIVLYEVTFLKNQ